MHCGMLCLSSPPRMPFQKHQHGCSAMWYYNHAANGGEIDDSGVDLVSVQDSLDRPSVSVTCIPSTATDS